MNAKCATLGVLTLVCLITLVVLVGRERFQEQNIFLVKRDKKPCPKGVITVLDHGRLCNQIFEYVSVWVLARRHGLLPFVPNTIHDKLRGLFAHLSIPPLSQLTDSSGDCPKLNKNSLNTASSQDLFDVDDRAIRTNESEDPFVLREYIVLIRFIVPILDEVKEEFKYRPEIVAVAQTRLRRSRSRLEADHGSRETLFVGVHVRRDDYFRAFKAFGVTSYADAGYYRHAVSWMLRKLTSETTSAQNIAFVLASDDPAWCKEVLVPELKHEIRAFGNHTNLGKKQVCWLYLLAQGAGAGLLYLLVQGAGLLVVQGAGWLYLLVQGAGLLVVQGAGLLYLLVQGAGWEHQSMTFDFRLRRTPLSIGSPGDHYRSRFTAPMGSSPFSHWTRPGSSGGYLAWWFLGLYSTSHHDSRYQDSILPPTMTHVARTLSYLLPRLTLPGLCPTSHHDSRCQDSVLPPTTTHVADSILPPTMTHVTRTLSYLPPRLTLPGLYSTSHHDSRCQDSVLPPTMTHVTRTLSYLPPRLTLPGLCPTSHHDSRCWDSILPPTMTHVAGTLSYLPPRLTLPGLYPTSHRGSAVFFLGEAETPEVDLVMLSSCNHSIVDYGTYGLWATLLVNGWTVVYDLSALNQHQTIVEINGLLRVAGLMSKWVMLT
uniref:L-Fucosyltransferase n=1 Tax=Timema shepardi TaxID=629360 RepID=A0A7R9B8X8_TIMSH|nr:unnamed protein product [Timema shepardi]